MTALTAAEFPRDVYQTTTIINQNDAVWGTGSFVKSSAQSSKTDFPWSSIVLDQAGIVAQSWQLQNRSSAIIVLDKQGIVQFVQEGALNDDAIQNLLSLIQQQLEK
ncbi:protein YtfJ precursor [Vibrio metschnikovii CIP 69.14]|nr:protein YtfJ precursor [Vibrio metschnikovii CIP 69.14]